MLAMRIIPLFKSHFSIGKSILTLKDGPSDEGSADSIIEIAKEANLKELYLVEDGMTSFMKADKACSKLGMKLRFGYRFDCFSNPDLVKETSHKVVVFARNTQGVKLLYKIYKEVNRGQNGILDTDLENLCDKNINIVIPFYDSYIAKNTLLMSKCVPNFSSKADIFYFVEDNQLPFDGLLRAAVKNVAGKKPIVCAKSIFYKNREDYAALQTYKVICNRKFGKQSTLDNPNLEHFASQEFCWESYLEQCKKNS